MGKLKFIPTLEVDFGEVGKVELVAKRHEYIREATDKGWYYAIATDPIQRFIGYSTEDEAMVALFERHTGFVSRPV